MRNREEQVQKQEQKRKEPRLRPEGVDVGLGYQYVNQKVSAKEAREVAALALQPGFEPLRAALSELYMQAAELALEGNRKYWVGFRDGLDFFFNAVGSARLQREQLEKLSGINAWEEDKRREEESVEPIIRLGGSSL